MSEQNPCETHAEVQTPGGYCPVCLYKKWEEAGQRAEQAEAERDRLKLEAESWAQEARTQRGTVREVYQLCTGATGEPGDWNGAEPVRRVVRERDEARQEAANLRGILRDVHPEIVSLINGLEHSHTAPDGHVYDKGVAEEIAELRKMDERIDAALQSAPPASEPEQCPVCERGTLTRLEYSRCDTCGVDLVTPEQARRNDVRLGTAPADRPVGHTPDREYDMEDYAGVEDRPFNDEKPGWNEDMARLASDRPEPSDKGVLECPECGIESVHTWEDGWRCPRCGELHSPTSGAAEYGATADDVRIWLDEAIDLTADCPEPSEAQRCLDELVRLPEPENSTHYEWLRERLSQPAPAVPKEVRDLIMLVEEFCDRIDCAAEDIGNGEDQDYQSLIPKLGPAVDQAKAAINGHLATHPADGDSPAVPDGYVLVPKEPTHKQCLKGNGHLPAGINSDEIYRAMIAAAPDPKGGE